MKKARGFKLGKRLVTSQGCASKAVSKLTKCLQFLKQGAKRLCFGKTNSGYFRVGQEPNKNVSVPKGHLAVYVGEQEDDTCRVVVPVIYFNHPLFVELLREAEMVYGYNHTGGIQIPCRISEFENIQSRIAATVGGGK
ncbi:auxin-responsive protein SAUR36-like [Lycium ferocissimum]|uniref:auxin-responsive protein SAUR36-like n=1 Tax=Lycium ferocissimum TaxID=112874 RepID=UPI0028169021|nr:auxin-responsive protein SAUR36-like [Lycium ferocissimum]